MKRRIIFLKENIQRFNENTRRLLGGKFLFAWTRLIYCFVLFGCSPDDFFRYRFYEKSNYERNKFISYRRSKRIIKKNNDRSAVNTLQDKVAFNRFFEDYIGRKWLDLRTATPEEFFDFVTTHQDVLMKPLKGGQGKGIFKITASELTDVEATLKKHREYIAEQILIQHEEMKKLNPTSVNTVRVLTFKSEVVACAIRTGGDGAIVDNLHSNGVCAHVDVETGIIDAPCIDNQYRFYLYHPTTKVRLVGFQVPNWEAVKGTACEAARRIPEVAYIGWDIAVLRDGVAIIEGNHDPGHDVVQMIAQTGLYQDIRKLEGKENRNEILKF